MTAALSRMGAGSGGVARRRLFEAPALPFYFIEIAAFQSPNADPSLVGWAAIREAQRRCLAIPHTGMACAIGLGDAAGVHPKNKADVGERFARWALATEYGQRDLEVSGPLFRELKIEGDTVVVSSPNVLQPVAVRYAYSSNPEGANLCNRAGLPGPPFRTDD